MDQIYVWIYIFITVGIALTANIISAIWAKQENKFKTRWFLYLLIISPLVFITFGLIVNRLGLAVGSATSDSLLTICTIFSGLIFFREFQKLSNYQFFGIFITICGIVLIKI